MKEEHEEGSKEGPTPVRLPDTLELMVSLERGQDIETRNQRTLAILGHRGLMTGHTGTQRIDDWL